MKYACSFFLLMDIVLLIVGLIIGCALCYFILRPKIKVTNSINEDIKRENNQLLNQKQELQQQIASLQNQEKELDSTRQYLASQISEYIVRKEEIDKYIKEVREKIDQDNEIIYQKSFDLMQEHLDKAAEQEINKFQQASEEANKEYLKTLEETSIEFAEMLDLKRAELSDVQKQLDMLRAKAEAAIAAAKREEEKKLNLDKYKILVTDLDLLEINRLREIAPYFRNARAIYKIIWESYYRNLTTDLINRVIGSGTHTGIYKITNLTNQKIYIGQAVDLATRWRDHIKAGLGIDSPSNMLYTAMIKDGVENFTFEVLEECKRDDLNDREIYYIEFYQAQTWGYNMGRGGSARRS